MTAEPSPRPPASTSRSAALRLLLRMGLLGSLVGDRVATSVEDPELVRHLPVAVLADLYVSGRRRPAELQHLTGLTSGGVTKLLDRLEQQGLATRSFGLVPGDRRAIIVSLTPAGERVALALADGVLDHMADVRAAFHDTAAILDEIDPGVDPGGAGPRRG